MGDTSGSILKDEDIVFEVIPFSRALLSPLLVFSLFESALVLVNSSTTFRELFEVSFVDLETTCRAKLTNSSSCSILFLH